MTVNQFVPPSGQRPEDFLTIVDSHGASINFERAEDGVVTVWIAPPGENDGCSVFVGEDSQRRIAGYLRGDA